VKIEVSNAELTIIMEGVGVVAKELDKAAQAALALLEDLSYQYGALHITQDADSLVESAENHGVVSNTIVAPRHILGCYHCGSSFGAKRSTAKFCSSKCRTANHRAVDFPSG